MGGLFSKLWGWAFSMPEFKAVVLGLNNAGKTTTVYKLLLGQVVATAPTVGSNVEEVVYKNLRFIMWDIGGQDVLRDSWNTYFTNTHVVIFVVDSTDRERLALVKSELHKLLAHPALQRSILLIFANKQDVRGAMSATELTNVLALHTITDHDWHIQSCCAITGDGLNEGMDWVSSKFHS
eukprot:TRINITY_DN23844_c0_g1_i1.p1 TRINITY_DN23844_c0_g1~~TRINITY_DN23844_c0_g1_i1.p1  ORF type:complete len:180 (-),score=42.04 TRINITY_DN23844_c0_g1_i1:31-570(-)